MKTKFLTTLLATSLLFAGGGQAALTVLIGFVDDEGSGQSIRNGGFEEGEAGDTFAETPFWSSFFPEGDDSTLTMSSNVKTGELRGTASGWSGTGTRQHPTQTIPASAWTIAAGDFFNVSLDWRNGAGFSGELQVILRVIDAQGSQVGDVLLEENDTLQTTGQYQTFSLTSGIVPEGSPLIGNQVQLRILNSGPRSSFAIIDNVSLTAIPEPSAALLGGLGLLALLRRRRR